MSTELTAEDVQLTIDEEFSKLVPRHTDNEAEEFRKSVEADGRFHYPILYWRQKQDNIIVDGRHRFELWCTLPEDTPIPPPRLEEVFYPDRDAVKRAIIRSRLARSSLDAKQRKLLIGRLYNQEKGDHSENLKRGENDAKSPIRQSGGSGDENGNQRGEDESSTADRISEETGTPARTVERYGALAKALDRIGEVNAKAKSDIESGALKVKESDIVSIGKLGTKTAIGKAIGNIRNGRDWMTGLSVNEPRKKKRRKSQATKTSPAKCADDLSKKHVGPLVRGIDKLAEINGGKGAQYKAADNGLNSFVGALKQMREGKQ